MTDKTSPIVSPTEPAGEDASSVLRVDAPPAAERIGVPDRPTRKPTVGIATGVVLGLAVMAGTAWWTLVPQDSPAPRASAQVPTPPAVPPPQPPAATPPASTPTPPDAPPADKPAPDTPPATTPPAPAPTASPLPPGPPLPPRTGAITAEPLDLVRRRATAGDVEAMEEMARRHIEGIGTKVDTAEGANWLQRAADRGSPGAMFNVGVMYERGMMVDKDPAKALEWYGKASAAGVPMATHNMALMYREGDGIPADHKRAADLLLDAARHGMSASMYAMATMFEAGSHGQKRDQVQAIVWYAMAMQFQRANPATQDSDLARRAEEKVSGLQRVMTEADLRRAQATGEKEYRQIIATLRSGDMTPRPAATTAPPGDAPASPPSAPPAADKPPQTASTPPAAKPPASAKPPAGKRLSPKEQLTEIQKLLAALHIYGGKVDGTLGPATRAAIKDFQRMAGLADTGEPSPALLDLLREQVQPAEKK